MEPESSLPLSQQPVHSSLCPSLVPILSQFNTVHSPYPTSWRSILIFSAHLNLVLASGLFTSRLPNKTLHASVLHTSHLPLPSHSCWLNHPSEIWWGVQNKVYCTCIYCHGTVVSTVVSCREVLCSDLDAELGYRDLSPIWFSSVPPNTNSGFLPRIRERPQPFLSLQFNYWLAF